MKMPPKEIEMIPVYLFLGFLESGKTKFIQETLEDKRFNTGENTLLLLCEEGEEEYDPYKFPKKNVFIRTLEDKSELTTDNLRRLVNECGAERIIIEYNGMWTVPELFSNMPEDWGIYQVMFFADSTTFLQYNINMRSLVVDKLNVCEFVVFNRFDKKMDMMEFHKIVRGVSRRTDIAYEQTDGEVKYDDIEDPLPFDIDAPEIVINDNDFALWYRDIMEEPKKYDGKIMTFRGLAAKNSKFPEKTFAIGRHIMTCCVDDIQYCWLAAQTETDFEPEERSWVMIRGKIKVQKHKLYRGKGPVVYVQSISPASPPEKEVATFY